MASEDKTPAPARTKSRAEATEAARHQDTPAAKPEAPADGGPAKKSAVKGSGKKASDVPAAVRSITSRKSAMRPGDEEAAKIDGTHDHLAGSMMYLLVLLFVPVAFMFPFVVEEYLRRNVIKYGIHFALLGVAAVAIVARRFVDVNSVWKKVLAAVVVLFVSLSFAFLEYSPTETGTNLYPYLAVFAGLVDTECVVAFLTVFSLQRRFYLFAPLGLLIVGAGFVLIQVAVLLVLLFSPVEDDDGVGMAVFAVIFFYALCLCFASLMLLFFLIARVVQTDVSEHPFRNAYFCFVALSVLHMAAAFVIYCHQSIMCYDEAKKAADSSCVI